MTASRTKRAAARILLSLVAALLGLLACEQIYRVKLFGVAAFSPRQMRGLHIFGESGLLRAAEHPVLRYQLKPELDTTYLLQPFRTNSLGLRDEEYPFEKPPGTWRIAVVGDSYTMGSGVAIEDVFHSVLEHLLDEDPGGRRFECINFGVAGYGIRDYAATVRHMVSEYDPDLILVALTRTDRMPAGRRQGPFVPKPAAHGGLRLYALEAAQSRIRRARHHRVLAAEDPDQVAPEVDPANPLGQRTFDYLDKVLGELAHAARQQKLPIVVVHLHASSGAGGGESGVGRAYRLACEKLGMPYFDASTLFAGTDPTTFNVFPFDPHPNAAGHAIFARGIHEFLLGSGLIPR